MIDMDFIVGLIDPALIIVVAACWVMGFLLKQTPRVPDWTIVYLVTAFAILLAIGLIGLSVETIIQGILCGAVSVYGHQLVKQTRERD